MRTHLWYKGIPALLFSFFMVSAQTVLVPTQYSTVAQALQFGTDILVTANITENIVISSMNVSITGADTSITITGKTRTSNSTVTLQTIKFLGRRGPNGNSPNPGYTYCPEAGDGGDGDTALVVTNSTITIINSTIKGGGGGTGGFSFYSLSDLYACDCGRGGNGGLGLASSNSLISVVQSKIRGGDFGTGMQSSYTPMCELLRGLKGIGVNASQYTTIDTMQVALDSVILDATSHIISGTSVAPSVQKELRNPSIRFFPSGTIMVNNFDNSANLDVAVYSMTGRLIYKNTLNGGTCFIPGLDRGVYLVTIINGNQKICGKFVKIK